MAPEMTPQEEMACAAEWTYDCSGKMDYDGPVVSISTRYWPRGGGFFVLNAGQFQGNEARPEIRPSAKSRILLHYAGGEYEELISRGFEADTEQEVRRMVEEWVRVQFREIVKKVKP